MGILILGRSEWRRSCAHKQTDVKADVRFWGRNSDIHMQMVRVWEDGVCFWAASMQVRPFPSARLQRGLVEWAMPGHGDGLPGENAQAGGARGW